jgi:hypothetical protein
MAGISLGERGRNFLKGFFRPQRVRYGNAADRWDDPIVYFEETFVCPNDFDLLVEAVGSISEPKLIVIDGHAKAGKTWYAAAAIAKVLDQNASADCKSWGEDSRELFDGPNSPAKNVYSATVEVAGEMTLRQRQLFFIDDLFGTVDLRSLGNGEDELLALATFFDADSVGPKCLWQLLHSGGTLVMTSRSSLLTAAEIILGCRIRPTKRSSALFLRTPRGLFRRKDGSVGGSFDRTELEEIVKRHKRQAEPNYPLPDITAFAPDAPREIAARGIHEVLFGPDFDALAAAVEYLKHLKRRAEKAGSSNGAWESKLTRMCRAYVLEIAPGLVFLGPAGYRTLGIESDADIVSNDLYLRHQSGLNEYTRVPSEFYVEALRSHFKDPANIRAAVYAVQRVVRDENLQIAVRGLLEQALAQFESPTDIPKELIDLVSCHPDPLFDFELAAKAGQTLGREWILKPGFCSALAWALFQLPAVRKTSGNNAITWIMTQLKAAFRGWDNLASGDRDFLLASYSTFLHYGVSMETEGKRELNFLNRLGDLVSEIGEGEAATKARMVLDDEIIWACTALPKGDTLSELELVQRLRKRLAVEAEGQVELNDWTVANRLFTIAWHNDEKSTCLAGELRDWLLKWRSTGEKAISEDPLCIDSNLKYHWWHFLTQRGAWMREWCFDPKPWEKERRRPASGSIHEENNSPFYEVVKCALSSRQTKERARRFRDCLMLFGTRSARIPGDCSFEVLFEGAGSDAELASAALEAVFELSREGFLTEIAPALSASDNEPPSISLEFWKWCKAHCQKHGGVAAAAWANYMKDLDSVTHLDLVPADWKEVLPRDW